MSPAVAEHGYSTFMSLGRQPLVRGSGLD